MGGQNQPRQVPQAHAASIQLRFMAKGQASAFSLLLGSMEKREFYSRYWERRPLLLKSKGHGRFRELLSMRDLDGLIHQIKHPHISSLLRVVKRDGNALDKKDVPQTERGCPDLPYLYSAFSQGYTLVLNSVDQRSNPVSALARKLEEELGHRIGVNAYFTPADSQGFLPHADDHDVFIVQLEGAKEWRVYEPIVLLPLEDHHPKVHAERLGSPTMTARLEPGDALYIPRGFIHEGNSDGAASLHLTVGMHPYRWVDAMEQALALAAEEDIELRRAIPNALLRSKPNSAILRRGLQARLRSFARRNPAQGIMARLRQRLLDEASPSLDGHFPAVVAKGHIRLSTLVRHRVGPGCEVSMDGSLATIRFAGNSVSGPASIEPALRFISATHRFKAMDIPGLSDQSKLVLVRRLVSEGLLTGCAQRTRKESK